VLALKGHERRRWHLRVEAGVLNTVCWQANRGTHLPHAQQPPLACYPLHSVLSRQQPQLARLLRPRCRLQELLVQLVWLLRLETPFSGSASQQSYTSWQVLQVAVWAPSL
jgi:hypothetical protein